MPLVLVLAAAYATHVMFNRSRTTRIASGHSQTRLTTVGVLLVMVSLALTVPLIALAAGNPMKLVGALNPWKNGQFSNVATDASQHVGYLGFVLKNRKYSGDRARG